MLSPVLLSEKLWIALVSTVLFPLFTKRDVARRCVELSWDRTSLVWLLFLLTPLLLCGSAKRFHRSQRRQVSNGTTGGAGSLVRAHLV